MLELASDKTRGDALLPSNAGNLLESYGKVPRWCDACDVWRPVGCSHCSACGRCSVGFDHHCIVIGVCIGQRSHRDFLLLCLFSSFCSLALFALSIAQYWQVWSSVLHELIEGMVASEPGLRACAMAIAFSFLLCCCFVGCGHHHVLGLPALVGAVWLLWKGAQLLAHGVVEGMNAYTLVTCGSFCPFAFLQAWAQLDAVSRGLTTKSHAVLLMRGEEPEPMSIPRLVDFVATAAPASLLSAIRGKPLEPLA
mmetsp:Transcript_95529/g.270211  ORF Transcript_95529/g.270211 Transcript_95529/m.270211 type:complete len:252 (-) Transcript_95529:78-833(-)